MTEKKHGRGEHGRPEGSLTRAEIHTRSLSAATSMLTTADTNSRYFVDVTAQLDKSTLHTLGDSFARDGNTRRAAAITYFEATQHWDPKAYEKLEALLREERASIEPKGNQGINYNNARNLRGVVGACARRGVMADTWINGNAIDPTHIALLKMDYYETAFTAETPDLETAVRYKKDVVDAVLGGELDGTHTIPLAKRLWQSSIQPVRDLIVSSVTDTFHRTHNDDTFRQLVDFSTLALQDYSTLDQLDAYRLQDAVERYIAQTKEFSEEARIRHVSQYAELTRLRFAHYFDPSPEALKAKVKELLPDRDTAEETARDRDRYLGECATILADAGNFAGAQMMIKDITADHLKNSVVKKILGRAKTVADVDRFALDASVQQDASVAKVASTKRALLSGDVDKLEEITLGMFAAHTGQMDRDLLNECVDKVFATDQEAGIALAGKVTDRITENANTRTRYGPDILTGVIEKRVTHGDDAALEELFRLAENPSVASNDRFKYYATLARLTASEEKTRDLDMDMDIDLDELFKPDTKLYIDPEGNFFEQADPVEKQSTIEPTGVFIIDSGEAQSQDDAPEWEIPPEAGGVEVTFHTSDGAEPVFRTDLDNEQNDRDEDRDR
jgi:hypothetical protein